MHELPSGGSDHPHEPSFMDITPLLPAAEGAAGMPVVQYEITAPGNTPMEGSYPEERDVSLEQTPLRSFRGRPRPPQLCFVQQGEDPYMRWPVDAGLQAAIAAHRTETVARLREEVGVAADDVPFDDIYTYFDTLGLNAPEAIVYEPTPGNIDRLRQAYPAFIAGTADGGGMYAAGLDVALISNGGQVSRIDKAAVVAHEMAHGADLSSLVLRPEGSIVPKTYRDGYIVHESGELDLTRGCLLGEGRAEMLATHFIRGEYPESMWTTDGIPDSSGLVMPAPYYRIDDTGPYLSWVDSAPAAATVEMLIAKEPSLLPVIVDGPATLPGLRATAQALNAVEPGLYLRLNRLPRNDEAFQRAAHWVVGRMYGGDLRTPLQAHDDVHGMMQDLLAERRAAQAAQPDA